MPWYNPTDPKQRNYMLGGIVALVAIFPFRMYVLTPRVEANALTLESIERLEGQNRRASVQAARGGGELEERNAIYERHVAKLEELIPAVEDIGALLDDINRSARRFDVEPVNLLPEPAEAGQFYDQKSWDVAVVGEYHNVGRFLTEIASLSRIVTPIEVDISRYDQPEVYPEMETPVVATFRIVTYVLPERPPAPPAAAGSPGA